MTDTNDIHRLYIIYNYIYIHITFSESAALGTWVGMVSDIHRRGTSPVKESCFFSWVRTFGTMDREPNLDP